MKIMVKKAKNILQTEEKFKNNENISKLKGKLKVKKRKNQAKYE